MFFLFPHLGFAPSFHHHLAPPLIPADGLGYAVGDAVHRRRLLDIDRCLFAFFLSFFSRERGGVGSCDEGHKGPRSSRGTHVHPPPLQRRRHWGCRSAEPRTAGDLAGGDYTIGTTMRCTLLQKWLLPCGMMGVCFKREREGTNWAIESVLDGNYRFGGLQRWLLSVPQLDPRGKGIALCVESVHDSRRSPYVPPAPVLSPLLDDRSRHTGVEKRDASGEYNADPRL